MRTHTIVMLSCCFVLSLALPAHAEVAKVGDQVQLTYAKVPGKGTVAEVYGKLVRVTLAKGFDGWIPSSALTPPRDPVAGFTPPAEDAKLVAPHAQGDKVLATWADGKSYPGTVAELYGKVIFVQFDDGDSLWMEAKDIVGSTSATPGASLGAFSQYQRVFALWSDGRRYPAKVMGKDGDKYKIAFPDGYNDIVPASALMDATTYQYTDGEKVLALWTNKQWYPGKIGEQKDGTLHIFFDDGDKLWVGPDMVIPMKLHK